jgi:hypothetical protein
MAMIGRTTVVVCTFINGPDEPYDRIEMLSLVLIESIEPVSASSSTAA